MEQLEQIEQQSEEELKRLDSAWKIFLGQGHQVPEHEVIPERQVTWKDVLKKFGIEIIVITMATLGAAYLSAIRVGTIVEISQIKLQESILGQVVSSSRGTFWASMFAIEGTLVGMGIYLGRRQKALRISWISIITAFTVTVVAGFMSSLTLVKNAGGIEIFFSWLFAVITAISYSVIAFFGSENGGYLIQEIEKLQTLFDQETRATQVQKDQEYQTKADDLQALFQEAYPRIAKQVYDVDRRKRVQYEDPPAKLEAPPVKNLRALVKSYLLQMNVQPSQVSADKKDGSLLTYMEIADALNLKGTQRDDVRKYVGQYRKLELENGKW